MRPPSERISTKKKVLGAEFLFRDYPGRKMLSLSSYVFLPRLDNRRSSLSFARTRRTSIVLSALTRETLDVAAGFRQLSFPILVIYSEFVSEID
jgi:hypothetical protein